MYIDSHNHPDWHGHNFNRFVANMDKACIEKTWLFTWDCPTDEFDPQSYHCSITASTQEGGPIPFTRCLAYCEQAPDRFVLGYAPDPRKPESMDQLRAAVSIHGVRIYGELKLRMMYDNPDALRMFRLCGELDLPVVVHIDYEFERENLYPRPSYWYGGGIEGFERAVKACPHTIFIGHAPGFWAHISGDDLFDKQVYPKGAVSAGGDVPRMLRAYSNLYCDLAAESGLNALSRDTDFTLNFLQEFQDRILFGRDFFDNRLQTFLSALKLPKIVRDKIYRENALALVPTR